MRPSPLILQGGNQGPQRSVTWSRPQRRLAVSQDNRAELLLWSVSPSISHVVFSYVCFLWRFLGEGILMAWVFPRSRWVIGRHRARARFDTAAFPSCTTLIPWWQNCWHLLSVAEVLGGMKINKAWHLCSRVWPVHLPATSNLTSLWVASMLFKWAGTFRNQAACAEAARGTAIRPVCVGLSSLNSRDGTERTEATVKITFSPEISRCSLPYSQPLRVVESLGFSLWSLSLPEAPQESTLFRRVPRDSFLTRAW